MVLPMHDHVQTNLLIFMFENHQEPGNKYLSRGKQKDIVKDAQKHTDLFELGHVNSVDTLLQNMCCHSAAQEGSPVSIHHCTEAWV